MTNFKVGNKVLINMKNPLNHKLGLFSYFKTYHKKIGSVTYISEATGTHVVELETPVQNNYMNTPELVNWSASFKQHDLVLV